MEDDTKPIKTLLTDREISMFLLKSYMTLNKEMGQVHGELKWIRWLLMGVLGGIIAEVLIPYIL